MTCVCLDADRTTSFLHGQKTSSIIRNSSWKQISSFNVKRSYCPCFMVAVQCDRYHCALAICRAGESTCLLIITSVSSATRMNLYFKTAIFLTFTISSGSMARKWLEVFPAQYICWNSAMSFVVFTHVLEMNVSYDYHLSTGRSFVTFCKIC